MKASDIDYEYPTNDAEATGYANLLTETRTALNQLASRKGDSVPYTLSVRGYSPNFITPNDTDSDP